MITITRRGDPKVYKLNDRDLFVQGHATNHIWGMLHDPLTETDTYSGSSDGGFVEIGLRFDSGDSGTIYLTKRQAHETINTLNDLLSQM